MDAARAEPSLRDLEAAAFAEQHVRRRHAHVLERDLRVPVRRIVVAEHRQHAADGDARRVHRHEDHRLLLVPRRRRDPILPMKMAIAQRGSPAPEVHHLRPLIT